LTRSVRQGVMTQPSSKERMRLLSGIQPSGIIHIGNYLGALKQWSGLQFTHESLFLIVDLHAITVPQDPQELRSQALTAAATLLACGIDPKRSIVFVQSHIPAHTELAWILATLAKMGELERMTQYKDKIKNAEAGVGLFTYPVLMAADILLYNAEVVPVGEDQVQHVELTRTLAKRFNQRFGETFVIPKAHVPKETARVMGLDDPTKKMSKSAGSSNYIALVDDPDTIKKKIARAVTDSGKNIRVGEDKPALTNLLTIYSAFSGLPIADLESRYAGKGYAALKHDLAEVLVTALSPIREKILKLTADPAELTRILADGANRARELAEPMLAEVKNKVGLFRSPS
jgi:tryptophanyl-tRNA synthetase